jgi:hypothetical protein
VTGRVLIEYASHIVSNNTQQKIVFKTLSILTKVLFFVDAHSRAADFIMAIGRKFWQKSGMPFSRLTTLVMAIGLLGAGSLYAAPVKKKKEKPKDPSKTAAPIVNDMPRRNPHFDVNSAIEGKVEDFAQGDTIEQRRERFRSAMIKKYNKDGSGNFTPSEETVMLQDFNAREMLLVQKYDWKEHDDLPAGKTRYMENVLYQKRLRFMKSFDLDNDGYLNKAEAAAMHAELKKRRDTFAEDFDR